MIRLANKRTRKEYRNLSVRSFRVLDIDTLRSARNRNLIGRRNIITTKQQELLSKVPEVTLAFWLVKILATTLGETGGDALSISALDHNYLISTVVFGAIFAIAVTVQILAKQFHPIVYWITIVATTTVGTTMADFVDRSLGIGYAGGSTIMFTL